MKLTAVLAAVLAFWPTPLLSQSVQADPNAPNRVLSGAPQFNGYGINYPYGLAATRYLYSPSGTWRSYSGLRHVYSYYGNDQERQQLIAYANGNNPATCLDIDANALFGLPRDGGSASGNSFMDHNGRGEGGGGISQPFSQFWHDHNKIAAYMALAYGAPYPTGLLGSYTRYQVIGLETNNWRNQGENGPEGRLLNGLYQLAIGSADGAVTKWSQEIQIAGNSYDANNQRYTYGNRHLSFELGLLKIINDRLLNGPYSYQSGTRDLLIQHSMSLRSILLSEQQRENGNPIGWTIGRTRQDGVTVINTHTTAINVLALGAGARYTYEAGVAPLSTPNGFFYRSNYHVLSAVAGQSPAGIMSYGPYVTLPTGTYTVDWYLRTSNSRGRLTAYLDVYDSNSGQVLTAYEVTANQWPSDNRWGRFSNSFNLQNPNNVLEFRVSWRGQADMDLGEIRIR